MPISGKDKVEIEDVDEPALEANIENLVDLESFTEGMILHHVRHRYEKSSRPSPPLGAAG